MTLNLVFNNNLRYVERNASEATDILTATTTLQAKYTRQYQWGKLANLILNRKEILVKPAVAWSLLRQTSQQVTLDSELNHKISAISADLQKHNIKLARLLETQLTDYSEELSNYGLSIDEEKTALQTNQQIALTFLQNPLLDNNQPPAFPVVENPSLTEKTREWLPQLESLEESIKTHSEIIRDDEDNLETFIHSRSWESVAEKLQHLRWHFSDLGLDATLWLKLRKDWDQMPTALKDNLLIQYRLFLAKNHIANITTKATQIITKIYDTHGANLRGSESESRAALLLLGPVIENTLSGNLAKPTPLEG